MINSRPGENLQPTYFLFGVSAKHFSDDVSTTVSQNATTGSATFISGEKQKRATMLRIQHFFHICYEKYKYNQGPYKSDHIKFENILGFLRTIFENIFENILTITFDNANNKHQNAVACS